MKRVYEKPEMTVQELKMGDVVCTSGLTNGGAGDNDNWVPKS